MFTKTLINLKNIYIKSLTNILNSLRLVSGVVDDWDLKTKKKQDRIRKIRKNVIVQDRVQKID